MSPPMDEAVVCPWRGGGLSTAPHTTVYMIIDEQNQLLNPSSTCSMVIIIRLTGESLHKCEYDIVPLYSELFNVMMS